MQFSKGIHAIDSHTAGEPTRIIVGGLPIIKGKTMPEKKEYLEKKLDHIRRAVMHEPRGHNNMFGSILVAPTREEADIGIIFMDGGGYLNMCGHGTIGAVTAMVETGMIFMVEPVTEVILEAPAGIVKAEAHVKEGRVKGVSFVNVPGFLYKKDQVVELEGRKINFDISFGGSFFALVNAKELGISVSPENTTSLIKVGMELRDEINKSIKVQHPTLPHIKTVDLVEIYDEPTNKEANYKNVVVFGQGQIDRSPCGTGTSAKLATLFAKGQIKLGEKFVYESILGTLFYGEIIDTSQVGDFEAIIPKITGSAYITGFNHLVIDEDDPLKYGFVLE